MNNQGNYFDVIYLIESKYMILCFLFQEEKVNYEKICEQAFVDAKSEKRVLLNRDWLDSPWKGVT